MESRQPFGWVDILIAHPCPGIECHYQAKAKVKKRVAPLKRWLNKRRSASQRLRGKLADIIYGDG